MAREVLTEHYKKARLEFLKVFDEMQGDITSSGGLRNWAKNNPTKFYEAFIKILPKEVEMDEGGALYELLHKYCEKPNA